MDDVYVTDHVREEPKRITHSEEEDREFFEYQKSIDEYNGDANAPQIQGTESPDQERATHLQRILNPFMGAGHDSNGTIVMNIDDKDMMHYDLDNEEKIRV